MNGVTCRTKAVPIIGGVVAVTAVTVFSASSAMANKPAPVPPTPPDAVLTWNTNAVNAVRVSSPSVSQVEGLIYMYVQAAVYDAVTKLDGRYVPYHDFTATVVPGASVQAAVAAAAQTVLDNYLPDQQPAVDAEYTPTWRRSPATSPTESPSGRQPQRHHCATHRRRLQRPDARVRDDRSDPAGQWQLQSPGQTAQTPGRNDEAVRVAAGIAVPRLTAARAHEPAVREADLNETEGVRRVR